MSTEELTTEESTALEAMQTEETTVEETPEVKTEEGTQEAPKTEEKPADESEKEKPPEGFVPHQAMHAERLKARQERERADALEKRLADIEAKISPQEQPPEYVDPIEDPDGFRKWAEYSAKQSEQKAETVTKSVQQQTEERQLMVKIENYEREFLQKTPDASDAISFLSQARTQELTQMGHGPAEVQAQLRQDVMAMVQAGEAIGMNPAELAYMRAKSMGYETAQPATAPQQTDAEKIAAMAQAQEATKGVGSSGPAQTGAITATQLAEMSEEEFAKLTDEEVRKAMGG
ncbi:hypothetical protein [uncultured Ruegeria sp.]|uniref:hypothetical protein n=1 Tax=uncultured Ruegeria sp. TaxID=259304 RepID=UPI002611BA72|nr:hypothetical protein [uncultured Ruegeria sp.]